MIPYGRQDISDEDVDAVIDVLRSDFLTQGQCVPSFEKAVSEYCGGKYAVAVNSATSALHLACLASGVTKGSLVWTSPITFVASANCALYCGAQVDFVDIDPETFNISVNSLEQKLKQAELTNCLPDVLIVVHFAGSSCDMEQIDSLRQRYGFKIIEDASHAIGGSYGDSKIGVCIYSDITVFSFHPVKIITTGEGGMAVTSDELLADKMRLLRSHGITRDAECMSGDPDGGWYYQQIELGFNYRMTDVQAALGVSQLSRLDSFIQKRNQLALRYYEMISALPVSAQCVPGENLSAWHIFPVRLHAGKEIRVKVYNQLRAAGVGVNVHYIPVFLQPYYKKLGFDPADFPNALEYYHGAITLPLYPGLSVADQDYVVSCLEESLR